MPRLLFLLFLLVPLLEIYLLIRVGSLIGALPTVLLVILTAVLGVILLRIQGFMTLLRVRESMARGEVPAMALLEGAVLLIGGVLLLVPGFFTDALGLLCLIPQVRRRAIAAFLRRYMVAGVGRGRYGKPEQRPRIIEGESKRED